MYTVTEGEGCSDTDEKKLQKMDGKVYDPVPAYS